jgi:hypothetical protein
LKQGLKNKTDNKQHFFPTPTLPVQEYITFYKISRQQEDINRS